MNNLILATDSYKLNHWNQYPEGTEAVYSYLESREGAEYPKTVFFGLQYLLDTLVDSPVDMTDVDYAAHLAEKHFGSDKLFNYEGWRYIAEDLGYLPLRIKAVPEGSVVPTGNVLMTVENTDPKCYWLTNALESYLTHVWYSSTVATQSYFIKQDIKRFLNETAESDAGLRFMLHDFGYRGATSQEAAGIGGAGHLVNFLGTDTLPAMEVALDHYDADWNTLAFSVPATEHSVMTAMGEDGETEVLDRLLDNYPSGILSVVSDSYDIYDFVDAICKRKERILSRDGVFVVRPDSGDPVDVTLNVVDMLALDIGNTVNSKGFRVLDPHVRVLWGDGIDHSDVWNILMELKLAGYSAENMVFGMGGGLLQKVNRDTQRFAFKCSAQKRNGEWHDISKHPLHGGKNSKKGRLALVQNRGGFTTVSEQSLIEAEGTNALQTVFENGEITKYYTFDEVRKNAGF